MRLPCVNIIQFFSCVCPGVGIGTDNPLAKVHIAGNAVNKIAIDGSTPGVGYAFNTGSFGTLSNVLQIRAGGSTDGIALSIFDNTGQSLVLKKNGYVGIGTESPSEKLDVFGNIKINNNDLLLRNGHNGLGWYGNPFGEGKTFAGEANIDGTVLYGYNGGALGSKFFYEDPPGTTIQKEIIALRWDKSGSVGIGTTEPLAKLHITHEGTAMRFQRTGFASYDIRQSFNSGLSFVKASNNQVVLHLADTGNVGIGTNDPLAKLDIRGRVQVQSNNFPGIQIINENTAANQKATVEFINTDNGQQTGNLSQFLQVNSSGYSSFIMRRRIPNGDYFDYLTFDEEKNNIILNAAKTGSLSYGDVFVNNGNALIMNGKIGIGLPTPADLTNPDPKTSLHIVSHGSSTAPTDETADIAKAGILLSSSYSGGVNYMPGLFWSNTNISTEKPSAGIWVKQNGGTDLYLGTGKNGGISSTVVIDQDGKVGIGTSAPQTNLHVSGTSDMEIRVTSTPNNSQLRLITLGNQQGSEIQFNNVLHFVVPVSSGGQSGIIKASLNSSGLDVFGTVKACKFKAELLSASCPDFVFEEDYPLPSLEKRTESILKNKHLPYIKPAKEMEKEGMDVSETVLGVLRNVEEHDLYLIQQNTKMKELSQLILEQQKQIEELKKEIGKIKK